MRWARVNVSDRAERRPGGGAVRTCVRVEATLSPGARRGDHVPDRAQPLHRGELPCSTTCGTWTSSRTRRRRSPRSTGTRSPGAGEGRGPRRREDGREAQRADRHGGRQGTGAGAEARRGGGRGPQGLTGRRPESRVTDDHVDLDEGRGARPESCRAPRPSPFSRCYGSACTCAPTEFDHELPAAASQLVDQVIAPRRSGYVFDGLKVPQLVPAVRQSRALLTMDGET